MKKYIFVSVLFASAVAFAQSNYPSSLIGGGNPSTDEYFNVTGADANPSRLIVNASTSDSDKKYAGMEGVNLSWEFADILYVGNQATQFKEAIRTYSDFHVKNTLEFKFKGKKNDTDNTWSHRAFVQFNVYNGAKLTIDDLYVSETAEFNASRIYFSGIDQKATANVTFRDNTNKLNMLTLSNIDFNYSLDKKATSTSLSLAAIYAFSNSTFNMSSDVAVTSNSYISCGELAKANNDGTDKLEKATSFRLNTNGYDIKFSSITLESSYSKGSKFEIDFSSGINGETDGSTVAISYLQGAYIDELDIVIKDFDFNKDKLLIRASVPALKDISSILEFEGYEGAEILTESITSGDYAGYTSYYVIPEPATYAIFAGLLALGLVIYHRRK